MTTTEELQQSLLEDMIVPEDYVEENILRHIVNPPNNLHIYQPGMSSQDIVDIARVKGILVRALCGVQFVPTRDPAAVRETCNTCMDIAGIMLNNPPEKG